MGFFSNLIKNPVTYLFPPAGIATTALGMQKDKQNRQIDDQIQDPGAPPGMLDPNDIGQPQPGGSVYAQLQRQRNQLGAGQAMQMNDSRAMGQAAQARSGLANRGGISSGASERVYRSAMSDRANSNQLAQGGLMEANLGTDIADEGMRRNVYNQIRQQNQQMQGSIYGSNKLANAQLNASRPQGLLGLGFLGL